MVYQKLLIGIAISTVTGADLGAGGGGGGGGGFILLEGSTDHILMEGVGDAIVQES